MMPVYVLQAGDTNHVKIGWAANVQKRISVLQTGSPSRLRLLRTIPGGRHVETWLHRRYATRRAVGEWFEFDAEMLHVEPPTSVAGNTDGPTHIAELVARFGGQSALGRLLGVRQSVVWEWVSKGIVPYERIPQIINAAARLCPPVRLEPNDFFVISRPQNNGGA